MTDQRLIKSALFNAKDAGKCLGMSEDWMRRMIKGGYIKSIRLGKKLFVSQKEINRVAEFGAGPFANRPEEENKNE